MNYEALPQKGVYPATPSLIDWLANRFEAIEQGTYHHYCGIRRLVRHVNAAERGGSLVRQLKAQSVIRDYNEENQTCVEYGEIATGSSDYLPAFEGDWLVFTDDSMSILLEAANPTMFRVEDALYCAPLHVKWAVLWDPESVVVLVYRSPVLGDRMDMNSEFLLSCGMSRGDTTTFALPPEVEGLIQQDLDYLEGDGEVAPTLLPGPPITRNVETINITECLPWLRP